MEENQSCCGQRFMQYVPLAVGAMLAVSHAIAYPAQLWLFPIEKQWSPEALHVSTMLVFSVMLVTLAAGNLFYIVWREA